MGEVSHPVARFIQEFDIAVEKRLCQVGFKHTEQIVQRLLLSET